jgi:hypothetical protein
MNSITSIMPRIDAVRWIDLISESLSKYTFNFSNEKQLQSGMSKIFTLMNEQFISEYKLSEEDIVDFYWPAQKVAVEVKIGGSLSGLTRQIHRYAQHEAILGILVVSSKMKLISLPEEISRKPIRCHALIGNML